MMMREELQNNAVNGSDSILEKQKEKIRQQKEQLKRHEETWRMYNKIVFTLCILLGSVIAIYVGGWVMFVKSILGTYDAYLAGTLTFSYLVKAAIKCIMAHFTPFCLIFRNIFSIQINLSGLNRLQPIDATEKCTFSASGRTDQHNNLSLMNIQRHIIQNGSLSIIFMQMAYFQQFFRFLH